MTDNDNRPDIVRLNGVVKEFRVRKDNSLKDRIVHFGRLGEEHRSTFTAVSDVTLAIEAGTTVGLLGANGSGKSTLLKLIGGIVSPTRGTVQTRAAMEELTLRNLDEFLSSGRLVTPVLQPGARV